MASGPVASIRWMLLIWLWSHRLWCHAICDWNNVKHVAFSMTPKIECSYLALTKRALIFKWVKTSHGPEYYWLKGNPYLPVNSSQLGPQRIQFSVKQEEVAGFKLCLEAVLPTSQGSASLPVEIKVNSFDDLFQPDRPDSARYDISLNAQLNRDGKSIQNYILSWTPQRRVIQNSTYLVLVYSRTSVIQLEARHPRLSLRNLDSGKPYKFCVIASKDVCQGTEWSCTVRLLPVPERDSSEYSQLLSGEKLTLIGTGSTSVQVSWVVPTYTVHRKPTSINRFYALSVYPIGTTQCEISIFYILAPWIQVHEMTIRNGLIDDIKARHVRRNVCTFKKEERLEPLGNWPDWEQFVELLDERNVPNEFTVTIPHLQPNQRYEVELWPTNHFISVKTLNATLNTNGVIGLHLSTTDAFPLLHLRYAELPYLSVEPEEDCNLRLQRKDTRTNVLSWTVPERVNNLTAMNNLDFQLELRRVNHIQTRSLRDTCYVRHCDLKGPSDPQFSEDPTNLLCERHRIAARTESRDQQFSLSCLLPCAVYDVSLTVVANDSLNPQLFSCRRRLLTAAEGTRPQLSVITLSNNMLLFALKEDRNSNYRTCASIGHTATLLNDKHEVMAQPMIFTLENLAQSWALPLLESPKEVNGLLSYRLMLPIPPTKSSRISLELDTFVASDRRVDPLVISSPMDKSACHLDCVWSLPLSNITLAPTSYQTSGQHMAYVVEFGHHESCNKSSTTHDYITTHCQTAQGFVYSDQTHCPLSGSWGTCSVPQCHEMAPITCIDATYPIYYTTRLQVSWGVPPVQNEFYQEWDTTVESTVYGYVATISKPSLTNQRGSKCIHAQLLYYADNDKLSSSRFVDSLMFSCKRRSTLLFKSTPTAHFTDLAQNTSYELRVTPFNAYGRLGATQKQILTTLAAKPCQPHRVGIKAVESQSLVIYASERTGNECGEGKTALLTYYKPGSRSQTLEFPLQSHTDLRLPDLDSCTEYCALVAYVNAVGRGPDSAEVCSTTKRQNFNGSPSISFKCGGPLSGGAHTDASAKGLKLVACKFSAQTDYTKLCPVHYEMEMSIFNAKTAQTMKFDRSEFIVDRYFQCGLYYQVRVRAVAPDYDALLRNDGSYISPYSQPIGLYTGMSDFRFEDLTIHVEPATNKGDFSYCTSPHLIRGGDTSTRAVESGPDDICFRLIWEIAGETQGLMGFVIQVFGNQLIESNSSRPLGAELSDYYEENNVGPCLRMIWIPCPLCLPGFNFTNARDKVIERLRRMIDHCTQINDFGFPRTVQTRSDGIEERIRITNDLRRMTSTTMAFLLPQSKSVDLLVNVSKLVKGPTSSNTADADRKIRQVRSSLLEQPSYYSGQDNNGFIRFYSVNTFDVVLTTEKPWHILHITKQENLQQLETGYFEWFGQRYKKRNFEEQISIDITQSSTLNPLSWLKERTFFQKMKSAKDTHPVSTGEFYSRHTLNGLKFERPINGLFE
ncbi:rgs-gaip interacting protein gipc [Clonorchis sinensis]|uniref:Rgs-gaip interacting protein gipc n=1 Tax=Clonorchis sinensis TaxID=79923 RepID=H2KUD8_CLOSI|nr:rgs-gaip interacting protein gipc [Clonorchis sinensis]